MENSLRATRFLSGETRARSVGHLRALEPHRANVRPASCGRGAGIWGTAGGGRWVQHDGW